MKILFILFLTIITFHAYAQDTIITPPPPMAVPASHSKGVKVEHGVIDFPDIEAQFVGGSKGLQQFISKNVNYPQEAINNNVVGRVYLSFIVTKKGKIKTIAVERGVHELLDKEAKRLIALMPDWIPAEKDGKKIKTRCRLPINFTL
jgi:protein TonB